MASFTSMIIIIAINCSYYFLLNHYKYILSSFGLVNQTGMHKTEFIELFCNFEPFYILIVIGTCAPCTQFSEYIIHVCSNIKYYEIICKIIVSDQENYYFICSWTFYKKLFKILYHVFSAVLFFVSEYNCDRIATPSTASRQNFYKCTAFTQTKMLLTVLYYRRGILG